MTVSQSSSHSKGVLKVLLKLFLGGALVIYVLRSRMIDFAALRAVVFAPQNMALGFGCLLLSALCSTLRWNRLARAQGLSLSFGPMFSLTMIGNFFNTFMPGAVGGDLVKSWYVAGREPQRKGRAVFTVLIDRVIGLAVILFYAAFTLLFFTDDLAARPQLRLLTWGIWAFTGTSLLFAVVYFASTRWRVRHDSPLRRLAHRSEKVRKLIEATLVYRHHVSTVVLAIALSAISILGTNLLYKFLGDALGIPMDLARYFFVVPIAITVSAVPLLPGGIGVGQVAFFTLFQWAGMANPEQGATLCTVVQIYTILFNCTGALFYLRFKRSPQSRLSSVASAA